MTFLIILLVLGGIVFYVIAVYNRFQQLKNGGESTLNQVKVALKKRLDMLSQLLDSVKSYASFEKGTLEKITEMRTSVLKASSPDEINNIERQSRQILGNILVSVENYPELKTSEIVKELTGAVQNIEDEIARHRYTYNNIVQEFNTMIDTVPSNFIAGMFGFSKMKYLEFGEEINKTPDLKWNI